MLRRGRHAGRGRHRDVGAGEELRLGPVGGAAEAHSLTHRARERNSGLERLHPRPHRRPPWQILRQLPQRAQEQAQRRALLLEAEQDLHFAVGRGLPVHHVGARRDHRIVAREEAGQQVARDSEAGGAPVEAAEQQLHEAARELGGEHALGRRMEGPNVERARVAQRGRRGTRRERLVHVHEVERGQLEELLDRARHVQRQRHVHGLPRGRKRQALAHGDHLRAPGLGEHRFGVLRQPLDRLPALADQLTRVRRRDHHHPVPTSTELVRDALHVGIHLMMLLPGVRGYLGDGEALGERHVARIGAELRGHRPQAIGHRKIPVAYGLWPFA